MGYSIYRVATGELPYEHSSVTVLVGKFYDGLRGLSDAKREADVMHEREPAYNVQFQVKLDGCEEVLYVGQRRNLALLYSDEPQPETD